LWRGRINGGFRHWIRGFAAWYIYDAKRKLYMAGDCDCDGEKMSGYIRIMIKLECRYLEALKRYDAFISEIVVEEARAGDPEAAKKRLAILKKFTHLDLSPMVEKMAKVYVEKLKIPPKALRDAVHLAVASVHSVDYLVTWNCSHIANGEVIRKLMQINMSHGIKTPIICTPEELMPKMKGE